MRLRKWWCRLALSASLLTCGTVVAEADQLTQDYPTTSNNQTDAELRATVEAQGRQIQQLLDDRKSTQATLASIKKNAENAAGPFEPMDTIAKPTAKVFGRMYLDHIMYDDAPGLGVDRMNETGFDTLRLGVKGYVSELVAYKVQLEFEGTEVDYKDVFIQLQSVPGFGNVTAGHFKEPWSLEEQTSSRFVTFMERSAATNAFSPQRNFGVMANNTVSDNENVRWYAGVFRNDYDDSPTANGSLRQDAGDWSFTTRGCWTPYFDENAPGRYLVHIGGGYSHRETGSATKTFRANAPLGTQGRYIGATFADQDWDQAGVEFAINWGAASFQTEHYFARIAAQDISSGYIQATYFLTGENRGYKRSGNKFERVKPFENAFWVRTQDGCCRGIGAWEAKARWDYINLQAGADPGAPTLRGYGDNFSTGFNWYLNPYTRFMFDYVYEDITQLAATGSANNFGVRFQVDW